MNRHDRAAFAESIPPAVLLIVACALWGAATVVNKALLASLPPLTLLFLELASSVTALWAILSFSRVQLPPPLLLWPIVALGVLNPGIVYALALMGLARVSASVTTLLWAAEPAMILTLAAVMLREPVSSRLLMVMAVGFVGVLLVADLAGGVIVVKTPRLVSCCFC